MTRASASSPHHPDREGETRPASPLHLDPANPRVETVDMAFLLELADMLNTTLDLQTLLSRTAELVREAIPYNLFAIFLLNDRTRELRMRFHVGHSAEAQRISIPLGKGVSGQVALTRKPLLLNGAAAIEQHLVANPAVRSELAVPLVAKNRLIGVIDLASEQAGFYRPEHLHALTLTASRIAQAIENARLYTRVSRQAQTLGVLNEIAVELGSILEPVPLLERVGQLLRRLIDYQMFSILLLDEKGETLVTRYAWRFGHSNALMRRIPISSGLVGAAVREWRTVNVPDIRKDPRYVLTNPETRSELIVPLFYKGRVIGVFDLEHTRTAFFTEDHERTLATLASQVAISIENARLYQTVRNQELQLERDIATAREVQLRLLPTGPPSLPHAELAVRFLPARTIGGDLYDFLDYGPGRTAIVMGDVSGKAAPAALFAALVSGIMRAAAARTGVPTDRSTSVGLGTGVPADGSTSMGLEHLPPAAMLALLNDAIQERKLDSHYVTMLFTVWDDESRTLTVSNSGAVQPILCRAGQSTTVKAEGFPLGLFPDVTYDEITVATQPGDLVIFASDGILDAENAKAEMYGHERLSSLLCAHRDLPADEVADRILADVARFESGRDRFDDETIIVLRVR
jgi:sigma-B regulation protein RsbU (phosphoserine phosphatase)